MSYQLHCGQILGRRHGQQDAVHAEVVADGGGALLVVCDGMGGHAGGEVASGAALSAFLRCFQQQGALSAESRLRRALVAASAAIADAIAHSPSLRDMGTTLAACYLRGRDLAWISVGDSPIRLIRDAKMIVINDDHSMAPVLDAMAASGEISREAALTSHRRHVLRSALTDVPPALIDSGTKSDFLRSGDLVMVASDGINSLTDAGICALAKYVTGQSVQGFVSALLHEIERRALADQDNTSIAACQIADINGGVGRLRRWFRC